ncbi:hypothetical protein GCM10027169_29300 [Gordonia jinhuaensis]|uniref:Pilus assembly protein TadE n=1 Tax=Gordonia jinhuaensis TaxID=1517702 RepID=A0A916T8M3_9ACTN|nr:TadE family type IV pilus minor pilin [Gordonia jinhuaensis]GGB35813.1 hypothetical protein GCM10011489_24820 [Gordonia jinhuaensis]
MVTVEAAFAIAAIVTVVVIGVGLIVGMICHIRCVDAARETARVAAYADDARARAAGSAVAPASAQVEVSRSGERVSARVRMSVTFLPGVDLGAVAVAVAESDDPAGS